MEVPILACGGCVLQAMQIDFPPTTAWTLLVPPWFLALSVLSRIHGVGLPWIPRVWLAVVLVLAALLAGAIAAGPLPVVPLGIACMIGSARFLGEALPTTVRSAGRTLTVVAAILFAGSAAWAYAAERTPATTARVLERQLNGRAWRAEFAKLRAAEPGSLPIYRELARRASLPALLDVTLERIEAIGDPAVEVPHLIDALEILERQRTGTRAAAVERTLARMSGCTPEPGSGAAGWRAAWTENGAR